MSWFASILYARCTPASLAVLKEHPVLGPALCHIQEIDTIFDRFGPHGLPSGGLLALRRFGPPDGHKKPEIPWDALWPRKQGGAPTAFTPTPLLEKLGVDIREAPPPALLCALKELAIEAQTPMVLYRCQMWGGEIDYEMAWVCGARPKEPDRIFAFGKKGIRIRATGRRIKKGAGDVLVEALKYCGLRLKSVYFVPHTSSFDWARARLVPRPEGQEAFDEEEDKRPFPGSLFRAVELSDIEQVRQLLERGADPNAYYMEAPLHIAAGLKNPQLLRLLLQYGANPMPKGRLTPLHAAADPETARILVEHKVPVNGRQRFYPPLYFAAQHGHDATARFLVESGASLRPKRHPNCIWFAACAGGLLWLAEALLDQGFDIAAMEHGDSGRTGLCLASGGGHEGLALRLLERGARPSESSFVAAAEAGSVTLLSEHLRRGIPIDAKLYGTSALCAAIDSARSGAACYLIEMGANTNEMCPGGSLLHGAAKNGLVSVLEMLFSRHPAPQIALEERDFLGWTPLFAAVWAGHQKAADWLLAHGARADIIDGNERDLREIAKQKGIALHLPAQQNESLELPLAPTLPGSST